MGSRRSVGVALLVFAVSGAACVVEGDDSASAGPRWHLPGADPYPRTLQEELTQALAARGPGYQPRTHHFREDGSPRYSNRLLFESSPYLLQHAHNPVNWYPWGDEAFETARRLGRPVLLSIGYSTCHWCHVMEEESFEDEEIAAFMNAHYVAVKVDREERPDVDSIYMSAVQMLTGRGGWPMTTWLTPDREPFYGGTYFPARDGDRGSRKGFLTLLADLEKVYREYPEKVVEQSGQISRQIRQTMQPAGGDRLPGKDSLETAALGYARSFDAVHGGRKGSPKFPSSMPIRTLLRYHRQSGDASYLDMATLTLDRMARGGMYDQIGGGFHRYSVDVKWLVPHFEKMLYDNALLTMAYLEGYQATGNEEYARVVREILRYVGREMTSPEGSFYSATDADSLNPEGEREEGWFFTWTPAELRAVLGAEEAKLFEAYYAVSEGGNFEGRNILHVPRPPEEVAREFELSRDELQGLLAAHADKLYQVRRTRPAPLRDDKILTSWNGLMISAFAQAGFVLGEPDAVRRAERAASFVLTHMRKDGRLLRSFKDGRARHNAYLDDYAFLIAGLLDLYESTADVVWLEEAVALQKVLDELYRDPDHGGYFLTSADHEALLAREVPSDDGAEPSGNSLALMNLLRLSELTTDAAYRNSAEALLRGFGSTLQKAPRRLSEMLLALDFYLDEAKEIVIVTKKSRKQAEPFLSVLRETYLPAKVVVVAAQGEDLTAQAKHVPLLTGKVARDGKATAYVCESGICQLPTTEVDVFRKQIMKKTGPGSPADALPASSSP